MARITIVIAKGFKRPYFVQLGNNRPVAYKNAANARFAVDQFISAGHTICTPNTYKTLKVSK